MTPEQMKLIAAAQMYDTMHRPAGLTWTRVPDEQVLRLLLGAKLSRKTDPAPRPCTAADQIRWGYEWLRGHYGSARVPE